MRMCHVHYVRSARHKVIYFSLLGVVCLSVLDVLLLLIEETLGFVKQKSSAVVLTSFTFSVCVVQFYLGSNTFHLRDDS